MQGAQQTIRSRALTSAPKRRFSDGISRCPTNVACALHSHVETFVFWLRRLPISLLTPNPLLRPMNSRFSPLRCYKESIEQSAMQPCLGYGNDSYLRPTTTIAFHQQASTHNRTSARSRNQTKDMRPILLNNAGPNALHSQQFRFISRCGRSDT